MAQIGGLCRPRQHVLPISFPYAPLGNRIAYHRGECLLSSKGIWAKPSMCAICLRNGSPT